MAARLPRDSYFQQFPEIRLRVQLLPKCVAFQRELYFLIVFWKRAGLIDGERLRALRC